MVTCVLDHPQVAKAWARDLGRHFRVKTGGSLIGNDHAKDGSLGGSEPGRDSVRCTTHHHHLLHQQRGPVVVDNRPCNSSTPATCLPTRITCCMHQQRGTSGDDVGTIFPTSSTQRPRQPAPCQGRCNHQYPVLAQAAVPSSYLALRTVSSGSLSTTPLLTRVWCSPRISRSDMSSYLNICRSQL
jgi:hypothetical protein